MDTYKTNIEENSRLSVITNDTAYKGEMNPIGFQRLQTQVNNHEFKLYGISLVLDVHTREIATINRKLDDLQAGLRLTQQQVANIVRILQNRGRRRYIQVFSRL